jgi:hypothetical protein
MTKTAVKGLEDVRVGVVVVTEHILYTYISLVKYIYINIKKLTAPGHMHRIMVVSIC